MATVMAVDWSGAADESNEKLWYAVVEESSLVEIAPSTRSGVIDTVIRRRPDVTGLDFSFSYPAWFLEERGYRSASELWADPSRVDHTAPPFWGWRGSAKPVDMVLLRRTEAATGLAKSTFQVAGAGHVGTGTRRGLPYLARLRDANFAVWPFDLVRTDQPVVVEIYPRLFTGAVVKSRFTARRDWWHANGPDLSPELLAAALCGEDAFDAAVSAIALARRVDEVESLPELADPELRLEGWIFGVPLPAPGDSGRRIRP